MPAAIKFTCPHCERICKVPAELGGKQGRCPGCKKGLEVPLETPEHLLSGRLSTPMDVMPPASEVRAEGVKATHADGSREGGRSTGARPSLLPRGTSGRSRRRSGGRRSARLSEIEADAEDFSETGPILCKACKLSVPAGASHCPHCKIELRRVTTGGLHWAIVASLLVALPVPILGLLLAQFGLKRARERSNYENLAWFAILVSGANTCFGLLYMIRKAVG